MASMKNTERCEHGAPAGVICGHCHPRTTPRKARACSVCGVILSALITYEDRAEHSADCYGTSLPLPARYG